MGNYIMKPTKTQQLQATASRIFGEVQIEYKPGGIRSGWYISKGEHTYCFGKNEQEAIEWLGKSPTFQASTSNMVDLTIVRNIRYSLTQLSVDPHELRIAASFLLKDILYLQTKSKITITSWKWCLGTPLKRVIGDYPDLRIKKRCGSKANKMAEILLTLCGESNTFRIVSAVDCKNELGSQTVLIHAKQSALALENLPKLIIDVDDTVDEIKEYVNLNDIVFTGTKAFYGHIFNIWLRHLLILPTEKIEHALHTYQQYYNSVTAPPHPTDINNTIIMLTVWELLANFIDASPQLKEDLTVSILSRFQPQERVAQ